MNLLKSITSERCLDHGTTYKLSHFTSIENRVSQLKYDNFKPRSFLEAQLFSIGHNYSILRTQMENMKAQLHSAALKIVNFKCKTNAINQPPPKRMKLDSFMEIPETESSECERTENERTGSESPEKILGRLIQEGGRDALCFAYGLSAGFPALLLHQIHMIDEAGQLEFFTCDCLAWLFWYGCAILGIKPSFHPVFYLVGSISQSFALRTIDVEHGNDTDGKIRSKKTTNETSLLSHLLDNKIVYNHLQMYKKGKVSLIHTGKRSVLPGLQGLKDSLWLGLKDPGLIEVLDEYLVPESLIMNPGATLASSKSSLAGGMNKNSEIIDHSRLDLSNYIRIFSSRKKLQEYRDEAQCLPHIDIPIVTFVNYHEAKERYNAYIQKEKFGSYFSGGKNEGGKMPSNVEEYTSLLLGGNLDKTTLQFLGNASLGSVRLHRIFPGQFFYDKRSFLPPEKSSSFSRHHIKYPCTNESIEEYEKTKGVIVEKVTQSYMAFKGKIQIIIDKFANIHRGHFFLIGYSGNIEQLMNNFMGEVLLPLEVRAPRYVLKMYQQIYTYMAFLRETQMSSDWLRRGNEDTGKSVYCHEMGDYVDVDKDEDLDLLKTSDIIEKGLQEGDIDFLSVNVDNNLTNDTAKLYLSQGRSRITELYYLLNVDDFCSQKTIDVYVRNPCEQIGNKQGIFHMQINRDYVAYDYVKQAENVLVKDKVELTPYLLRSRHFDATRRLYQAVYNQIGKKEQVTESRLHEDLRLYGLYVQRQSGQLGIILPSEFSFVEDIVNDKGTRVFNNLMLSISCSATSEIALTIPISQGLTLNNCAVLVEPSMCFNQINAFVALTRAKYNVVLSRNPFKVCKFIPQYTVLRSMLNENTRHII